MEHVCNSLDDSYYYGFNVIQDYATDIPVLRAKNGMEHEQKMITGVNYDLASIMHYPTTSGRLPENPHDWILARWRNGGKDFKPPATYDSSDVDAILWIASEGPSEGDVEVIRRLYP